MTDTTSDRRTTAELDIRSVVKDYHPARGWLRSHARPLRAVNEVSVALRRGETLGIVGESGCGKSTLAKLALGLEKPTSGEVVLQGRPIAQASRSWRSSVIQLVMQDPYSSLNPRMTVYDIVAEAYIAHPNVLQGRRRRDLVVEMLDRVGLGAQNLNRFPHQLSGGQRQRVGIARALAPLPSILVCDEPVSALDVSVQAQVINLLRGLQKDLSLSYVFISHDLAVVRHMSDRIAVMYLGTVVEEGPAQQVYERPAHPYTQALLASIASPAADGQAGRRRPEPRRLIGELPDPTNPPSGCPFRTRCWKAQERCAAEVPLPQPIGDRGQTVRCHFPETEQTHA